MAEGERKIHQIPADKVVIDTDAHADATSRQLFSLGRFLKYAAIGSPVAAAALAAFVASVTQP